MPLFHRISKHLTRQSARHYSAARVVGATVVLLALAPMPVRADAVQDASSLIKQEKFSQAIDALDKFLAQKPGDPQARFLRGIALTELGKTDAAISVFQKLTEEYPTLPEPYNNLAVIYAQQKQYDKAKQSLEMAIRTHPAYATAHENLGDIYARLATQAYDKALQLDSSNTSAQHKLAMIRDLMGAPKSITKAGDSQKPVQVAVAPPAPTPAAPPAAVTKPAVPAPVPAAPAPEQAKPAVKPPVIEAPVKPADSSSDSKAVNAAIDAWAAAWARKDVKAYLAAYARDFKVPGGKSRSAWETERRQRIDKPGAIELRIDRVKVSVDGDKAVAQFRQSYRSGKLDATANKRLELGRRDGRWQITQEAVGG